ncbi:phosphoglycerate dehydrogenase [Poriferisphaera sp. WC338]|uniref:phosphoglycerate dehydrogenase n=1 Tax=Poriferisphaera sp. WC338 TaxID=3425129 RepID=UPI003D812680
MSTSTFRVLAADKLAQEGLDFITDQSDCELVNKPGLSEEEYATLIQDCDAMIVRSGIKVTAKILENPGKLKVIARAGVGVDNIDLKAATEKGILVVNTAAASTITTAEHAFALMMSLLRNVGPAYKGMTEGKWDRNKFTGRQLHGKSVGVVGFGRIGQTFAERALAFGMDVVAYDPFINAETMLDGRVKMFKNFEDILPHADILSFHVPLNDATRSMLNKETYKLCRDGLYVVNAARGGVVDEADLLEAVESGKVAAAALDVFTSEPPAEDDPLRNHPQILITPHLGASTKEAQQAVSVDAAENCLTYLRGDGIVGAVNAGNLKINLSDLQEKYVDLAGRMAKLISPMITRGISEVSIGLTGKELAAASSMIERTALVGIFENHLTDPVNIINVNQVAEARSIKVTTTLCDDEKVQPGLTFEIKGPQGAVDSETKEGDKVRRITGRVYDDLKPRIVEINGYFMDMIPEGPMVILLNEDRPGMIGLVGTTFGGENVNIADMAISRRDTTAMMVLKVDSEPTEAQLDAIKSKDGILKTAAINLPATNGT